MGLIFGAQVFYKLTDLDTARGEFASDSGILWWHPGCIILGLERVLMKRTLLAILLVAILISAYGLLIDKAFAGEPQNNTSDVARKDRTPLGIQGSRADSEDAASSGNTREQLQQQLPPVFQDGNQSSEDNSPPPSDD